MKSTKGIAVEILRAAAAVGCLLSVSAGCVPATTTSPSGGQGPPAAAAQGPTVTVTPGAASVSTGGNVAFKATVTGTASTSVSWSVREGVAGGSITSTGSYTAPQTPGTYTVVASLASDGSPVAGGAAVTVASTGAPGGARYLGVNLTWAAPFTPGAYMWADMLKSARPWQIAGDQVAPLDANGWPSVPAGIGFMEGTDIPASYASGIFKLRFKGPSNSAVTCSNCTITNLTAPDGNGYRTADLAINSAGNTGMSFSTPVQDVSLMRPGYTRGVDYWASEFVAAIAPFGLLRTMETFGPGFGFSWGATDAGVMSNRDTTWASRTKPGTVGYAYNGPALEEFIIMANMTGKDIWINIPHQVDNDYITKLAQLLLYGSNGTTGLPFTSNTHDPATWNPSITTWYPGLKPGRKVYIEYSNEIWNFGGPQDYAKAKFNADIAGGDPLHFNALPEADRGFDLWVTWQVLNISTLFRAVWGDTAMQSTVRIVLANQGGWGSIDRHRIMLDYIKNVFGGSTYGSSVQGVPTGRPVNHYIHNISGAAYMHWGSSGTVNEAIKNLRYSFNGFNNYDPTWGWSLQREFDWFQDMAAANGIRFTLYEVGQETNPGWAPGNLSAQVDADPQMKQLYLDLLHYVYSKANVDVAAYFWIAGNSSIDVGLGPDLATLGTPRWQAVRDIASGL